MTTALLKRNYLKTLLKKCSIWNDLGELIVRHNDVSYSSLSFQALVTQHKTVNGTAFFDKPLASRLFLISWNNRGLTNDK